MEDNLQGIEQKLKRLETEVVAAYREHQRAAANPAAVRFADEIVDGFTERLETLRATLYATGGSGVLRLVTDEHDALRIRMIYLQHLLEREIPRVYLDRALFEPTAGGAPATQPRLQPEQGSAPPRRQGGLMKALFGSAVSEKPAPRSPAVTTARTEVQTRAEDPHQAKMRLIYMHKLMEEDHLRLLSEEQRPPRVAADVHLPDFIANFTAKDFAETHFAVRATPANKDIARTPEELRAKLAKREGNRGQD